MSKKQTNLLLQLRLESIRDIRLLFHCCFSVLTCAWHWELVVVRSQRRISLVQEVDLSIGRRRLSP